MPPAFRQKRISPRLALILLLAAAVAWVGALYWQSRSSPAWQHIQTGYEYARQGDPVSAVQEWHRATQLDPDNVYAWQLLGQSYFSVHKWERAREAFEQIRRIDPNRPHVYALLAACAFQLGDLEAASQCAQEELKRNPDDISALETCAMVQSLRGNLKEQIRCLRRLTALQPRNVQHLSALAQALLRRRDMAEARAVADRLVRLAPDNAEAYAQRGLAGFYTDGSPQGIAQAEGDFRRALSLQPRNYPCHLFLAKIYRRRGEMEKAALHLKEAIRLDPKNPDAYLDLADVYERTGQPSQAAAMRRKFRALVQEAEEYVTLKTRCDVSPDDFELHLKVGTLALKRDELPSADRYLQRAHALRPGDGRLQAAIRKLEAQVKTSDSPISPSSNSMPLRPGGP